MSRNEMFLLLACLFAVAIMSGPKLPNRAPPASFMSLASASSVGEPIADITMLQHSLDYH